MNASDVVRKWEPGWKEHVLAFIRPGESLTASGVRFDPLTPQSARVFIEDIAHSLARLCRWTGHIDAPHYSVAQHCVLASRVSWPKFAAAALLHDAAEAYLNDLASPAKKSMPEYRRIENRLLGVIFARFGVVYPLSDEVKVLDQLLLVAEARDLFAPPRDFLYQQQEREDAAALVATIKPWDEREAESQFLSQAKCLGLL